MERNGMYTLSLDVGVDEASVLDNVLIVIL